MRSHVLIPMAEFTAAPHEGAAFPTARRTRWAVTLRVATLSAGGSVTVRLEGSPTGTGTDWATVYTFPAATAVGDTLAYSFQDTNAGAGPTAGFTVTRAHMYVRAVVAAVTGRAILEVEASARFLDPYVGEDARRLSQELRGWDDGRDRTVEEAEATVVQLLTGRADTEGRLWAWVEAAGFADGMARAVALQAEHLFARAKLERTRDKVALTEAARMPRVHPAVEEWVRGFRVDAGIWRGR